MNRRLLVILALLGIISAFLSAPACADQQFLWAADTSLGGIADKAKIGACLDSLEAHGVSAIWVQVEFPGEGTVSYKKTTLSGLRTAAKFKTGNWADDDFLSYVIDQARSRGMKVIVLLHGSSRSAWDANPDWRKRDSKGREVLSGGLENFCTNSPYWDNVFFPMLREIAANYDVHGFCLDTSQVALDTYDSCFCAACKARFEKETGKTLPLKPVDRAKWVNPTVKLHAIKRVEWSNRLFERFSQEVGKAKPGTLVLLKVNGRHDSYKDAVCARHADKYATCVTPELGATPRGYAVARNEARKKAGQPLLDEGDLARQEVVLGMNRYGYYEFMLKRALADGGGKPMIPISEYWFAEQASGYMGPLELEIAQIELAITAGAKGYCFSGSLASALAENKSAGTTWQNPEYIAYLKDLTAGERAKWIADMQPDSRVAILCDREADFWAGDGSRLVKSAGALFAALQYWRKTPVTIVSPSEPDQPGFGQSGYRLTADALARYDLVIAAGLDYVSRADLQTLREYLDKGGRLLIMGAIGRHGKFLGQPISDDAYEILGITTVGDPEPSGFVLPAAQHPVFMVPKGFTGPMGTFRISDDKYDALSYKPKFGDGWEVLANEVNDNGRRAAILVKETETGAGNIGYLNSDMVGGFSSEMLRILANMVVFTTGRSTSIVPLSFSETASINAFKSSDGLTRYIHISTLDGESEVQFRIRADKGAFPVSAEIILGNGKTKPLLITQANRAPEPGEMIISQSGHGLLKLSGIEPPSAIVKIKYEAREEKPAEGQG
ncbi:MAG TPA: beta-galactosidase [Armatimonadota bacterium]|nr:beta-galactosidase [Armatimonadota bacterium]